MTGIVDIRGSSSRACVDMMMRGAGLRPSGNLLDLRPSPKDLGWATVLSRLPFLVLFCLPARSFDGQAKSIVGAAEYWVLDTNTKDMQAGRQRADQHVLAVCNGQLWRTCHARVDRYDVLRARK